MDKYKTKSLNTEEKELMEALNKMDTKEIEKPSKKEQKQFKEAAKCFKKRD